MVTLNNDYNHGAHPKLLERLVELNNTAFVGYGQDTLCQQAKDKIRDAFSCPDADIFFSVGGTQTNQLVIDMLLNSYQGVISAQTGHINAHEAGAVEFAGHKVLGLPSHAGKLDAEEVKAYIENFYQDDNYEHMVFPAMVYISFPTEYGTLYSKAELEALSAICRGYDIPLFLDGARLGYGLMSPACDVTPADIARLTDVFYVGGTKVGALMGEAVVFPHHNAPKHCIPIIKQHGALLAKGWLLGAQFDTLFTDGLYWEIGTHAIQLAQTLETALEEKGYSFLLKTGTNQIFVILENSKYQALQKDICMGFWEKYDDNHTVVRFATSWSNTAEDIQQAISLL